MMQMKVSAIDDVRQKHGRREKTPTGVQMCKLGNPCPKGSPRTVCLNTWKLGKTPAQDECCSIEDAVPVLCPCVPLGLATLACQPLWPTLARIPRMPPRGAGRPSGGGAANLVHRPRPRP